METLIALRYFVVKDEELFNISEFNPLALNRENILIKDIINGAEFKIERTDYAFRTREYSDIDCFASLAKKKTASIGSLDKSGVKRDIVDDWTELPFYVNFKSQLIILPLKESIIKLRKVVTILADYKQNIQKENGYSIRVEPIVDPAQFWNILNNSNGVFEIRFELVAPNLFGATKSANEFQKELKERFNQDKFEVALKNKNAALKYTTEEEALESYRDYADSGGGSWLLKVLQGKKKVKTTSYHNTKSLKVENKIDSAESLMELRQALLHFIAGIDSFLNNQGK